MGKQWLTRLSFQWFVIHKAPDVIIETAKLTLNCQEGFRIADCGIDLEAIANDSVVLQQRRDLALVVSSDFLWIEAVESGAVVVTLAKNGFPTEPGLSSFENQKLEETRVVVNGY